MNHAGINEIRIYKTVRRLENLFRSKIVGFTRQTYLQSKSLVMKVFPCPKIYNSI